MNQFIQISDCHIDDTPDAMGVNTHQNLEKIINKISTVEHQMLLITGDLTHNGTIGSYQTLKQILAPLQSELLVIPGNHDDQENLNQTFCDQLLQQKKIGNWELFSIDSVQTNKTSGFVTQKALNQLDQQLSQSSALYQIIVLHHPIVPMDSDWDDALSLENPNDLFNIVEKHPKIRVILFGHAHESSEFFKDNITIISCPSTALQFNGRNNEKDKIGFNHYTLFDDGKFSYQTLWL